MRHLLFVIPLAACVSSPSPQPPITDPVPTGLADTCRGERYGTLVGQDATALEKVLILGQVRILRPGTVATQDFRPERLNFEIGTDNRIRRINSG